MRWERVFFFVGVAAALAILSSCGSSSTAVSPTISASCISTEGSGSDVTVNGTAQCTATVLNASSTLVNWSVSGTGNGSIDTTSGLYTAPSAVPTNNVVTITATSQVQSTLTATASVTIEAATAITAVICDDASGNQASVVSSNNSLTCTAFSSVSTGTTVPVNWTVANAKNLGGNIGIGSISSQGVYTAPLVPPPGQMVTITATSKALSTETMSVTVQTVFGSAVLSGQYAFSTTGRTTGKNFWARVGNLSAGGGTLSGLEDTNQGAAAGSPNTVTSQRTFTGSYSVGPDGRGTMQFCENNSTSCPIGSLAATSFFQIAVVSPQQIQIIEFSSPTGTAASITAGGEMILQDPSIYSNRDLTLSTSYSFSFLGVTGSEADESAIGEFTANGHGTISAGGPSSPGEIDINPLPTGGSPAMLLAGTTYAISSNGRGTMTLDGLTFAIYPVSAGQAKFIEIDAGTTTTPVSILAGDAYIQQAPQPCVWDLNFLKGSTVLETTGSSSNVLVQDVGSFTASAGAVSSGSLDQNSGGTASSQLSTLTGSYTMDACGRGTLSVGAHSYVFYAISTSDAVLQEITTGVVAEGLLMPSQGGPFVDSTLTGNYAFRLGGTDAAGTSGSREDLVGQFSSAGSGTGLAGTLDLNDFGNTQSGLAIANGTYAAPNGLRTTMTLPVATSPSTTRNLVVYMVSPTLFYTLETDATGTALGVINNQF